MENSMTEQMAEMPAETIVSAAVDVPAPIPPVGEQLKAAREKAGMQVVDVAKLLKLGARQVDALENGDWAVLPGATFVRGFVRNYARLLALDPVPLMLQLEGVVDRPATVLNLPKATPTNLPYGGAGGRRDRNVVLLGLAAVVLAALAYFLLPNDLHALREEAKSIIDSLSRKEGSAVPAASPSAPAGVNEPVFPPGTTPQQIMNPQALLQNESAPVGAAPLAEKPASSGAAAELSFTLSSESWIEVRDRDDKIIFSQRLQAGAQQTVSGQGPLSLVIGYAPGVTLLWRGQPVDLAPHAHNGVARLVLE